MSKQLATPFMAHRPIGRVDPKADWPSIDDLEEWVIDSVCEAACHHQCMIEHDGRCEHGFESWVAVLYF